MPDVIVCGPASWNHVVDLDALPRPVPHMQFARGDRLTLGGTSAGKALHLTDLGRPTLLHTVVGTDQVAETILAALASAGVDVVAEVTDGPSERHLNLMGPGGERVSLYLDVPVPATTTAPAGLLDALGSARAAVLDLSTRSRDLVGLVATTGVPVWTDVHDHDGRDDFHRPFLDAADYVFMNADKLAAPLDFLRTTVGNGASVAVCTLGAEGAVAVDAHGMVHRVSAVPVADVVDTNGAGDAFMAGFLHATLDGAGVGDALAAGAAQAARALTTEHLSPLLDVG
ncbi:carbohydrate kinase family protein [Nocardioides ungokensis]|uniref:carbohydrate kinase family protein n=1 Tax=Nocardioides ungokensis TaxID=1643322 RepID=UPI0015DF5680|nr:carbohydrate kinase family protein [Nocardioides ungokensis]